LWWQKKHSINKPDATPLETPEPYISDTSPIEAPAVEDGDIVIPSTVIDGLFENKRSAAKEAEKQAAEMDKWGKDAPEPKRGRPPREDKAGREPQTEKSDKPEKPKRGEKPPKTPKDKKAASFGGGASGQTTEKEETPPTPVTPPAPEPPRDANRINETETIIHIEHSELHHFKNHPFQIRDDDAMKTFVTSIMERGVEQPAFVHHVKMVVMDTSGKWRGLRMSSALSAT